MNGFIMNSSTLEGVFKSCKWDNKSGRGSSQEIVCRCSGQAWLTRERQHDMAAAAGRQYSVGSRITVSAKKKGIDGSINWLICSPRLNVSSDSSFCLSSVH